MIQPPFLKKGDTIGITAPGRKLAEDIVNTSRKMIESWGMRVKLGSSLFSNAHSYLAGSDKERLDDFQAMLDDAEVKAIFCARGGYGTTRILDQLDFTSFIKNPKWICGFSDITALHLQLQKIGVESIHSTMPVLFPSAETKLSAESLFSLIEGNKIPITAQPNSFNRLGTASGQLIGGNLSLIADSLGTSTEIETENKILVLEEVDEYNYRIDRMLVQLKRAGKLNKLAGLVIGHFSEIKESELPFGETVENMILNHSKEYSYPVGFNFPIGHNNPNMAWVEGSNATLSITQKKSHLHF